MGVKALKSDIHSPYVVVYKDQGVKRDDVMMMIRKMMMMRCDDDMMISRYGL